MCKLAVMLAVMVALMSMPGSAAAQTQQSIWDKIESSGTLAIAVWLDTRPYSWKDLTTGTYHGTYVNMERAFAEDLSKAMGKPIKVELFETSQPTVVLDIQSAKIDFSPGMGKTPERLKAIDMAGPAYDMPHCLVHRKGFEGWKRWADYSKPEIRISAATGSTDEKAARENAPNATFLSFKDMGQVILSVQAGQAEALVTSTFGCLDIKKRNPDFGILFPTPLRTQPSFIGMRKDGDGRFYKFVQAWAEKSRASGLIKKLLLDGLREAGLNPDELPPEMVF